MRGRENGGERTVREIWPKKHLFKAKRRSVILKRCKLRTISFIVPIFIFLSTKTEVSDSI